MQTSAPMSVFLYIEPLEVRKEIIVRPLDLEHWILAKEAMGRDRDQAVLAGIACHPRSNPERGGELTRKNPATGLKKHGVAPRLQDCVEKTPMQMKGRQP